MKSLILGILLCFSPALYAQKGQPESQSGQKEQTPEKKAPSLADLAKQERERRAQNPEPVRVISNADLRTMGGARVSTAVTPKPAAKPSGEAGAEGEAASEGGAVAKGSAEDTQFWANAFQEAKGSLQSVIDRRMVLELRMNNLRNAYLNTDDGTTREKIQQELAQTYQEVGQAREDEKAAREALRQLERQATRVGITPGQIRDMVGELPESKSIYDGVPGSGEVSPGS